MDKLETLLAYLAARAAEPSTWQGVAFLLALTGSRYASLDWGVCVSIGATLSAVVKIIFPDVKPPKEAQ
jgi:hypothetical protein